MKKKNFWFFFFLILFNNQNHAYEIRSIVTVDENNITNYDLQKNIELTELIQGRKVSQFDTRSILESTINLKIKEIELNKLKIEIKKENINKKLNSIINQISNDKQINNEMKDLLYKQIETQERWNRLIFFKFKDKLEVNINEINEIAKLKNLNNKQKEELIFSEKNKKINIISNTYFNEIKSKYLIKMIK